MQYTLSISTWSLPILFINLSSFILLLSLLETSSFSMLLLFCTKIWICYWYSCALSYYSHFTMKSYWRSSLVSAIHFAALGIFFLVLLIAFNATFIISFFDSLSSLHLFSLKYKFYSCKNSSGKIKPHAQTILDLNTHTAKPFSTVAFEIA